MRNIILISGKDSACTAVVQREINPTLDYEYIFNSTGMELPPVFDWLDKVGNYLGAEIKFVGADLEEIIYDQGILPSPLMRFCTRMAKIKPLENYLSEDANVYYGLRYDEPNREGYSRRNPKSNIYPSYPLRDMKLGLPEVWTILEKRDLLTPFFEWHEIVDRVKSRLNNFDELTYDLKPWQYRKLFSWRVREFNCAMCMYMRQYEFIGLHHYFPDFFWKAVEIEENNGAEGYTLLQNNSLRDLLAKAEQIKERRVNQIVKILLKEDRDSSDELNLTSCGLLCGK